MFKNLQSNQCGKFGDKSALIHLCSLTPIRLKVIPEKALLPLTLVQMWSPKQFLGLPILAAMQRLCTFGDVRDDGVVILKRIQMEAIVSFTVAVGVPLTIDGEISV